MFSPPTLEAPVQLHPDFPDKDIPELVRAFERDKKKGATHLLVCLCPNGCRMYVAPKRSTTLEETRAEVLSWQSDAEMGNPRLLMVLDLSQPLPTR